MPLFLRSSSSAGGLANLCAISISSSPLRDTLFYLPRRLLEKCFALLLFTKKQKIIACSFDENNVKRIDTRSRRDYTRRSTLRACLALPERSFLLSPGLFSASSPPCPVSLSLWLLCVAVILEKGFIGTNALTDYRSTITSFHPRPSLSAPVNLFLWSGRLNIVIGRVTGTTSAFKL